MIFKAMLLARYLRNDIDDYLEKMLNKNG